MSDDFIDLGRHALDFTPAQVAAAVMKGLANVRVAPNNQERLQALVNRLQNAGLRLEVDQCGITLTCDETGHRDLLTIRMGSSWIDPVDNVEARVVAALNTHS